MKYYFSLFVAFFMLLGLGGCFAPASNEPMPPPTPPMTSQDIPSSPLGDIDPNMGYGQNNAGGTLELDRPLTNHEKLAADPIKQKQYNDLKKKKEWHEKEIKQAKLDRIGADLEIIKIIQGGHKNDLNDNPTDPETDLKHQEWIKTQCDIVVDGLSKDLNNINNEMDKILNESNRACFPKGTQVLMSDGGMKNIDEVTVGERVMVYDIGKDSINESTVKKVWIDQNNHVYVINGVIQATAYERLLTDTGWKKMRDIKNGEKVFNGNDYVLVHSKEKIQQDIDVYNLTIAKSHNFFVATKKNKDSLFLVHNTGGGGSGGGGK